MDNRSPRSRGILGPRPTPLKVRGDSHKIIKKPPLAPQPQPHPPHIYQQEPSQSQPSRGPVIIYTISPKIIHTHPNNFMTLVQRLTGKTSTSTASSSSSTSSPAAFDASCGLISPAARFASTEKASTSNELGTFVGGLGTMDQYYNHHHQQHQHHQIERPSFHHAGILSPEPTSLPLISPDFFSTVGPHEGFSSFFNDLNSILQTSPSTTQSPSSKDVFNNFFDS